MADIRVDNLNLWYGDFQALIDVGAHFPEREITAMIGPSGCGKSTLLRVFNRMNDFVEGVRVSEIGRAHV
jgi:phosphate transport system ATP-binding protein